jgi:hypothetical protein
MAAMLSVPVRWYSGPGYYEGRMSEDGHRFTNLELELERTAFLVVDSDCGEGNPYPAARPHASGVHRMDLRDARLAITLRGRNRQSEGTPRDNVQ